MANEELSGVQKAAILLITLGPEKSADIFKHLKEDEIEELTLEIANTQSVSPKLKEDVINEFYQVCLAQQYIAEGGIGYAKELLEKALGADEATRVITKLTASLQVRPFEFIRKTEQAMEDKNENLRKKNENFVSRCVCFILQKIFLYSISLPECFLKEPKPVMIP